jgi:hypothetical protein
MQFLPLLQDLSNFIRRAGRLCVNMVHQVPFPHFSVMGFLAALYKRSQFTRIPLCCTMILSRYILAVPPLSRAHAIHLLVALRRPYCIVALCRLRASTTSAKSSTKPRSRTCA